MGCARGARKGPCPGRNLTAASAPRDAGGQRGHDENPHGGGGGGERPLARLDLKARVDKVLATSASGAVMVKAPRPAASPGR